MNFVEAVQAGYRNYVTFSGRASRSELWWWVLFQIVMNIVIAAIFGGGHMAMGEGAMRMHYEGGLVANLWALANFLPGLSVGIRRLHDVDKSGWWTLIALVPVVGIIVLIVWYCTQGTPGSNRFGPAPAGR
ncbi:DUF805 domain-containing protein [bacterium]|nr:DUF805 domain-containing protein [bacterium]